MIAEPDRAKRNPAAVEAAGVIAEPDRAKRNPAAVEAAGMSSAESWHEQNRDRLAALRAGDRVLEAIAAAGWPGTAGGWRRTFGRTELDREHYATLVFESRGAVVRVEALAERPRGSANGAAVVPAREIGWLRMEALPHDPALTTLGAVMTAAEGATVVRYRPYRRCTVRVDGPGGPRFAKVFADERGRRIHAAGQAIWAAAERGELPFAVPRPAGWSPPTRAVWQGTVAGEPAIACLYGEGGAATARAMGAAAAALTRAGLEPPATYDAAAQLDDSRRKAGALVRLVPRLRPAAEELLAGLRAVHARARSTAPRPIHGAPHANQWLIAGDGLGLVDFDGFALGDPERDAATFMAELDFEDRAAVPVAELNRAFLDGYSDRGVALEPSLLAAYRAHKRLAKALRTARALRPDGDERAERHLARAAECIATPAGAS